MGPLNFVIPETVVMERVAPNTGRFILAPLEPGYGVTVGNALRRVLLSSLQGYAITSVKIPGVDHEFSTIPNVIEDVVEIILNLKGVRFKSLIDTEDRIFVSVKGKTQITAADIAQCTNAYTIPNPDHIICHLSSDTQFDMELTISKGLGYRPGEENKVNDAPLGTIATDSIFTPIKNVKYQIQNTRVEQRIDYEELILEVVTDGTIDPEVAVKEASATLTKLFVPFSDNNIQLKIVEPTLKKEIDENYIQMRKLLKTPLNELDLSVRAFNCLKAAEIRTLGDLVSYNIADLLKFRNFGKKSLSELEDIVNSKQLNFGLDISRYNLDED